MTCRVHRFYKQAAKKSGSRTITRERQLVLEHFALVNQPLLRFGHLVFLHDRFLEIKHRAFKHDIDFELVSSRRLHV